MSLINDLKKKKDAEAHPQNGAPDPRNQNTADLTPPSLHSDGVHDTTATRDIADKPDKIFAPGSDLVIQDRKIEEDPDRIYSTPLSEAFSLQLTSGTVTARDGQMKVSEEQHNEIQKLIKSGRPDIAQNVVLLDPKAAEAVARAYIERHKKPDAVKGMFGSESGSFREIKPQEGVDTRNDLNIQAAQAENLRRLGVEEQEAVHAEDQPLRVDPNAPSDTNAPAPLLTAPRS